MTKNEIILQIRKAYLHVIEYKNAVQKVHLGFQIKKDEIYLSSSLCAFGKWYNEEDHYLKNIKEFQVLGSIHDKTHLLIQSIYKLNLHEVTNKGNEILISNTAILKNNEKRLMDAYCHDFKRESDKLTAALKELYNKIVSIPDNHFSNSFLLTSI